MRCRSSLTTGNGTPVVDDMNSLAIGEQGLVAITDQWFIEKIAHFNRERIANRVAFTKGVGAHGYYEVMESLEHYTKTEFLKTKGKRTPIFARFSLMTGEKGGADTARDVRGLGIKFYTEVGNCDLILNSFPVMGLRDMMKYPDFIHSRKPAPNTNLCDIERFFDFFVGMPEMTNMLIRLYSDQGTRKSYQKMPYYSGITYSFVNDVDERNYVRFTVMPLAETEMITRKEATRLAGESPDVACRDFYDTLYSGNRIEFHLCAQIRKSDETYCGDKNGDNPLDSTKTWSELLYPKLIIGKLVLNRPPQNYFAEVEQVAFCANTLVPGIQMSPDRFLQGLAFAQADENRYRLGANYLQLPINSPKVPVTNYQEDGMMRYYADNGFVNYKPSFLLNNEPRECLDYLITKPLYFCGYAQRVPVKPSDDFMQAAIFYLELSREAKTNLANNFAFDLQSIDPVLLEEVLLVLDRVSTSLVIDIRIELEKLAMEIGKN